MRTKKYRIADSGVSAALQQLILESSRADGYTAGIDLDASMNAEKEMDCVFTCEEYGRLAALLSVFAPGREEIEVNALVHPGYRNRGCFKTLVSEAISECARFGYDKGLFVCNSASEAGKAVMAHWGCGTDHVEMQMECDITPGHKSNRADIEIAEAEENDIEQLAVLGAAAFGMEKEFETELLQNSLAADDRTQYVIRRQGRLTALCAATEYKNRMMIYGLGVHPDERRKGYAKALIDHIADVAARRGVSKLGLDVDEENENARALYESYGFKKTGSTQYRTFYFDDFK